MSLILDALRKADAERERGAVPGLHAQPVPPVSIDAPRAPDARPWLWAALGIGVGVVAAAALYLLMREASAPPAPPSSAAAAPSAPPPAAAAIPPAAAVASAAAPMPPVAEPAPWPPPEPRKAGAKAADPPAEPVVLGNVAAGEPAPLPDHLRAQLPPLTFGGSIYSNNPANRSLIIDGRLYREGEQVSPDVKLETIKPKGAVLLFRGYRYEVQL